MSIIDAKCNILPSFLASSDPFFLFLTFVSCHAGIFSSFSIIYPLLLTAGDLHWSVESTVDSLYSSSSFSFLIRPCSLLSMSSERAGFHQPRLSKSFLACHCQVPCAKNVNTRVEVDFLCKFVSLLLKPQMFFSIAVSPRIVGANEGQMKLTFRTRKTGLMASPQSKNKSRVACKSEVVVQHEVLQDSECTSAMVT